MTKTLGKSFPFPGSPPPLLHTGSRRPCFLPQCRSSHHSRPVAGRLAASATSTFLCPASRSSSHGFWIPPWPSHLLVSAICSLETSHLTPTFPTSSSTTLLGDLTPNSYTPYLVFHYLSRQFWHHLNDPGVTPSVQFICLPISEDFRFHSAVDTCTATISPSARSTPEFFLPFSVPTGHGSHFYYILVTDLLSILIEASS